MPLNGKRVLFVTEIAGFPGGIERYAFDAAARLRLAGAKVELCYRLEAPDAKAFLNGFDAAGRQVPAGTFDRVFIHKVRDPERLQALFARFGDKIAVIVHDHDYYCPRRYCYTPFGRRNCSRSYSLWRCGFCGMAASPRRWPEGIGAELREKFIDFPQRLDLLRQARDIIVLSRFMKENLERNGFSPDRIHIIHPAAEPARPPEERTPPVLAFVGQLIRGKGAEDFLRMLRLLHTPCRAVVAGEGNEGARLKSLAAEWELPVEFPGKISDPGSVYARSSVVVLPFRWQEPFGLVGIEAAAHGVPVVAYGLGGVSEWLKNEVTGLAVAPGNIPELAAACDRLLDDPALRRRLGDAALAAVGTEYSAKRWLAAFEKMIDGNGEKTSCES